MVSQNILPSHIYFEMMSFGFLETPLLVVQKCQVVADSGINVTRSQKFLSHLERAGPLFLSFLKTRQLIIHETKVGDRIHMLALTFPENFCTINSVNCELCGCS